MPSDLEKNLIDGGVTPVAAKVISNAIANVASGRLSVGRQLEDATPASRMRLIDSDTRKYVLTNLDYDANNPQKGSHAPGQYVTKQQDHPYQNSQPASATPTISTTAVKAGKYITVSPTTTNNVSQSEVTLRVVQRGGNHPRLNPSTGEIEAVPFLIEIDPQNKVVASVEERADATVLKLRFVQ